MRSFKARITNYTSVADNLYKALNCIEKKMQVNPDTLNSIAKTLNITNTNNYINHIPNSLKIIQTIKTSLADVGFYTNPIVYSEELIGFPDFIISLYQSDNSYLNLIKSTADLTMIDTLLSDSQYKGQYVLGSSTKNYLNLIMQDEHRLNLWKNLTKQQRAVLDRLFTIWNRILSHLLTNLLKDEICTPPLVTCLSEEKENCYTLFMLCQSTNNKPAFYYSVFETHAVLREQTENAVKLTPAILESLCPYQPVVIAHESTTIKPIPLLSNINQQTKNDFESTPATSLLWTGTNSFLFSLIDELAQTYLAAKGFTAPFYKILINAGYTIFYYSMLSFFTTNEEDSDTAAWQMSFSIAFALIRCGLDLAKEQQRLPQTGRWAKYLMTAGIFASQAILKGPIPVAETVAASIAGSAVGNYVANRIRYKFG